MVVSNAYQVYGMLVLYFKDYLIAKVGAAISQRMFGWNQYITHAAQQIMVRLRGLLPKAKLAGYTHCFLHLLLLH